MQISLEGKVALVTGASRGIGRAITQSFCAAGAKVMMTARKREQLEAAAADIDGETAVLAANAGDPASAGACVDATLQRFGRLDILVNNAATNPYFGPTLSVDEARWDKTFQVNLRGPVMLCESAWNKAFKERPGVIINISSLGGKVAEPGLGVYNLTKAAMIHLTTQLAGEIAPTRVVGVAPGLVETDFSAFLVENFGEKLASSLPLRRLGRPQDIANLVTFLASDLAEWITGQTFVIDGGSSARSAVS